MGSVGERTVCAVVCCTLFFSPRVRVFGAGYTFFSCFGEGVSTEQDDGMEHGGMEHDGMGHAGKKRDG